MTKKIFKAYHKYEIVKLKENIKFHQKKLKEIEKEEGSK